MRVTLTPALRDALKARGVECLHPPGISLPAETRLEPPCSLKWVVPDHSFTLGAFSYAVSGYCFAVSIGRYTSIGEQVQAGRGDHPTRWLSTSPAFYLADKLFDVGTEWPGAAEYHAWRPALPEGAVPTHIRPIGIGNDVYIGHGAFIRPGVTIGDGAIVGAHAVVVRDVPPYAVVAGNPASVRKYRIAPELIEELLRLAWWRFAPWQLRGIDVTDPAAALPMLRERVAALTPYQPPTLRLGDLAAKIEGGGRC